MIRKYVFIMMCVVGCSGGNVTTATADATVREPLVQLPYVRGSMHVCTQGEESMHEHADASEKHDLDLAAVAAGEDVVAPVAGVAYRHGGTKFGTHVNIDLGNNTYVVVAFLKNVTVADEAQVAVGQVIGQAGSVHGGASGVHLGLHRGDANEAASGGTSIEMGRLLTRDTSLTGGFEEQIGAALICGAGSDPVVGHTYESATVVVARHLPGTLVKTASSAKVYMVNVDGTSSWVTSEMAFLKSGFTDAMIVSVSEPEMSCYGIGASIDVPLAAPTGTRARDGSLLKVVGQPAVYAVSGGIAWPIKFWDVFVIAGYDPANVVEVTASAFPSMVTAVGDCASGENCLDLEYLGVCAHMPGPPILPHDAGATDTDPPDSALEPDGGTPIADASAVPEVAPASMPDAGAPTADAVSATADAAPESAKDFSWVYRDEGSSLCLNGWYFSGGTRAALLIWSGPGADGLHGPVATRMEDRFCWDFGSKFPGLYRFWADVPDPSCADAKCPRDSVDDDGAQYGDAPAVSGFPRTWLHCDYSGCATGGACGCDGMGYWDGSSWTPAGS